MHFLNRKIPIKNIKKNKWKTKFPKKQLTIFIIKHLQWFDEKSFILTKNTFGWKIKMKYKQISCLFCSFILNFVSCILWLLSLLSDIFWHRVFSINNVKWEKRNKMMSEMLSRIFYRRNTCCSCGCPILFMLMFICCHHYC